MRYLLLFALLLFFSCNDDIGMGDYPLDVEYDSLFLPQKSRLILLPDSANPVTGVSLIEGSTTTPLNMQYNGYYLGSVTSASYLGNYDFTLQIHRGLEKTHLTYQSRYSSSALYFLCSPLKGEIVNMVTSTNVPSASPLTIHNESCTLTFSPNGTVQKFPGGSLTNWYLLSGYPMKAVWGDSLEEYFWGHSDTLYQLSFGKNELGEKTLCGYETFTDTAAVALYLNLSSFNASIIQAHWEKKNWPSTSSRLTLYLSTDKQWNSVATQKYDVTHNTNSKIQIHNLQKGLCYWGKLVAKETDGTLIAESPITACYLGDDDDKGIPQSFELYGLALTSNSITFRLPDLSFPDFKSLTIAYTTGYITPTDSTKWDTTVTITDSGTEEFTITNLTAGTEYTFAAYLLDSLGNEVLSKPYLIRLPEATE